MSLLSLTMLAGCVSYSPEPGKVPGDALASMYTSTPTQQVATCIAQAVGVDAQKAGADYVITGRGGTSYTVGPNQGDSVYPVRVVVRGSTVPVGESERTALCLRGSAQAA